MISPMEFLAENVLNFTNPQSITTQHIQIIYFITANNVRLTLPYTIPAIVTEVSAKFVATTTLRVFGGVRWNTFNCMALKIARIMWAHK